MDAPKEVIREAQHLIDDYGNRLKYLGDVDGQKAWLFEFPDDVTIGFPFLYLLNGGEVIELTGLSVFDVIDLYVEDFGEIGIE